MEKITICLDTSVLIEYFRKKRKEQSLFYKLADQYERFAISAITEFEIRSGIKKEQVKAWEEILVNIEVLAFDTGASRIAVALQQELKKKRKQLDIADLFIAATALRYNTPMATLNKKHFARVDELILTFICRHIISLN